jgi:signal peptidase II
MNLNIRSYLFGPLTVFGLVVAALAGGIDQASKLYLLYVHDLAANPIRLGPFFDFVLTKNTGISYGLFASDGDLGRYILLGFKAVAVAVLWGWLSKAENRLTALALGLIIGGALGNATDRLVHGWVVDFVFFHVSGANWRFNWYVFNLADVAIVAGVIGLLYESLIGERAAKAP